MKALVIQHVTKANLLLLALVLAGLAGGIFVFSGSYLSNTNVLIGICLFPFALLVTGPQRNNALYILLMCAFLVLAFMYELRIFYFFALIFYFLWLIELLAGRLNVIVLFLAVFMSPIFIQVVTILGFPIRLFLSKSAGEILTFGGVDVQIEGNLMMLDGGVFSVNEACIGLNMLIMSGLMGIFVLVFHYRFSKRMLGLITTTIFFGAAFLLNLVANLIRIIVLVFFHVAPHNPMHELIGILCLILYVVVPLHFIGGWMTKRYGQPNNTLRSEPVTNHVARLCMFLIPAALLFVAINFDEKRSEINAGHAEISFGKHAPEKLPNGVSKISTDEFLIYVKIIPEFFTGEHTPLMCWTGSGYEFTGITTTKVQGIDIYKGTLTKDDKVLHTAWWYSNGHVQTISQLDWRVRMLKGESKFSLVNVTAADEQKLLSTLQVMMAEDILKTDGL